MKYQYIRERNFILLIPFSLMLIFGLCVEVRNWQEDPPELRVLMVLVLLLNLAVIFYLLYFALRSAAYAEILEDGIHVISKEQGEIMVIPWEKVKDCRQFSASVQARRFILLPLRWNATFCGKPLSTYKGSPPPQYRDAAPYLLDNLMEKLVRGQMTPEAFQDLPLLLLGIGQSENEKFEHCRALWRAKIKPQPEGDAESLET